MPGGRGDNNLVHPGLEVLDGPALGVQGRGAQLGGHAEWLDERGEKNLVHPGLKVVGGPVLGHFLSSHPLDKQRLSQPPLNKQRQSAAIFFPATHSNTQQGPEEQHAAPGAGAAPTNSDAGRLFASMIVRP